MVNSQKIQGPVTVIKFLGIMWLGKILIDPEAVIGEIQDCPTPKNLKEEQTSVRIWGLEDFHSPPGRVPHPSSLLVKKRYVWDWGSEQQASFEKEKH